MSNIDKMTANEQLFTELTPEEGAVVEGGLSFLLHGVYAKLAEKQDDLYLKFNGKKVFGTHKNMKSGRWYADSTLKGADFTGTKPLHFYDDDKWPNGDDYLGTVYVQNKFQRRERGRVKGHGYDYTAYFSVV